MKYKVGQYVVVITNARNIIDHLVGTLGVIDEVDPDRSHWNYTMRSSPDDRWSVDEYELRPATDVEILAAKLKGILTTVKE